MYVCECVRHCFLVCVRMYINVFNCVYMQLDICMMSLYCTLNKLENTHNRLSEKKQKNE